jgi:oligopeptide transport system ATP-binding protein
MSAANGNLIEVEGLTKHFPISRGTIFAREVGAVRAVDGVDFAIGRGETLGLVGESGCGKSTTGRMLIRLIEPTSGTVRFEGQPLQGLDADRMRALRREMQIIFQDPFGALNPRMAVQDIIAEPLVVHRWRTRAEQRRRVRDLLEVVGLAGYHAERFPHEFSGGQLQRIAIARALMPNPRVLIADEPVSALDVSIQAQVLNLLKDLVRDLGLGLVFIAHDLAVVAYTTSRVYVMSAGKIVETGKPLDLFRSPQAEATRNLVAAILTVEAGLNGEAFA